MSERGLRRVLVIDDDELNREVLELLLTGEGYRVELAGSGEAALEQLDGGGCPDVILMDMQMPGVSGEALIRRLREACAGGVRVIAMSGSERQEREAAGADGFLLKPFSVEQFGEVLGVGSAGMAGRVSQKPGASGDLGKVLGYLAGAAEEFEPDGEVLDGRTFESFRAMLGEGALSELYSACLRDAAVQWGRMGEARSSGDDVELRKFAHAMKGSLGMLGARELEEMCLALETGVVNATYVAMFEHFPDAIERLRGMLVALGVSVRE